MAGIGEENHKKRKLPDVPEIEIDVSAPEPPSKKALRKAKKKAGDTPGDATTEVKPAAPTEDKDASKKRSDYGVWIGNLAFSITKDDLRKFFIGHCSFSDATITRVHMPKGAEKHGKSQNKGFAYVDFSTEKAMKEALGLSEQLLSGRRVLIKDAKNFSGRPEKSQEEEQAGGSTASGHPPSKRIFVGNLGFDATKEILEEHFSQCGPLAHVHIATFQDSGKCKGYGWVTFEDLAAAEAAVKGFVMVNEDDDEEEEEGDAEEEAPKKSKKPRQKRVWVNNLLGRRMRMEFAEDATTRYKKRFGKDGEGKKKNEESEISEVVDGQEQPSRPRKGRQGKPEYSRYDEGTVQKLSGAIVEAQGQKITFD
jgi:RNA recognition motif-containing protein